MSFWLGSGAPFFQMLATRWRGRKVLGYLINRLQFTSVQLFSHVQLFVTPWTAACQASLCITTSRSLLKLMSIESGIPSNHLILCYPFLLPPSIFPSIRVFSNESVLPIRCPKYWSFSFSISPSNEYSGLISFRMDVLDLLAVQGTLESLLHSSSLCFFTTVQKDVNLQKEGSEQRQGSQKAQGTGETLSSQVPMFLWEFP